MIGIIPGFLLILAGAEASFEVDFGYFLVQYDDDKKIVNLEFPSPREGYEPYLQGKLGVNLDKLDKYISYGLDSSKDKVRMLWGTDIILEILPSPSSSKCKVMKWTSTHPTPLEDCFMIGNTSWYGGPEHMNQYWPVEKLKLEELPYVPQQQSNVGKTEPYWFNSNGVSIYIDPRVPLFVDVRNHRDDAICFIASDEKPYLPRGEKLLQYTFCKFDDPRQAHEHAIANFFDKPIGLPDARMVEYPVWSSWVRFKWNVNDSAVLDFAKDINIYGFNNSQIEIDDNWETCYGSALFNKSRFGDMNALSEQLKKMGFRITLWTHPFVNNDCPNYEEIKKKGYFVKNVDGSVNITWWDGKGSVVDFTNTEAAKWFSDKHRHLLAENGIDGLKFDAGEIGWLPQVPELNCSLDSHPRCYSQAYADTISKFGGISEMRVSFRTQKHPIFLRMLDKDSKWTFDNGLPTIITTMFVQNLQGYPFVLPDMVGGNAYAGDEIDKELFIRWLQANCFMPSIQFSAAPWDFDLETIRISLKFTALHYQYSKVILDLMNKSVETGAPVNAPIWWVDAKNSVAHIINDEYLLGEDILVAPVMEKGAIMRDIYLPKGYWREENHKHRVFEGRRWLKNYKADLATLPYFTRVHNPEGLIVEEIRKRFLAFFFTGLDF